MQILLVMKAMIEMIAAAGIDDGNDDVVTAGDDSDDCGCC